MAPLNDDMRDIIVQSRTKRLALFEPVSELSRRLQPNHLVGVTARYAKQKVARVAGGVAEAVKENGGTAAALALGAVAMFDAGRKSAGGHPTVGSDADSQLDPAEGEPAAPGTLPHTPGKVTVTNMARAKALAGAAGGLLLGRAIGNAFEPTAKERALFGKAGAEVQGAADKFVGEHARGAKLALAQAFGFARYAATFLTVLAAASDYFVHNEDKDRTS